MGTDGERSPFRDEDLGETATRSASSCNFTLIPVKIPAEASPSPTETAKLILKS